MNSIRHIGPPLLAVVALACSAVRAQSTGDLIRELDERLPALIEGDAPGYRHE